MRAWGPTRITNFPACTSRQTAPSVFRTVSLNPARSGFRNCWLPAYPQNPNFSPAGERRLLHRRTDGHEWTTTPSGSSPCVCARRASPRFSRPRISVCAPTRPRGLLPVHAGHGASPQQSRAGSPHRLLQGLGDEGVGSHREHEAGCPSGALRRGCQLTCRRDVRRSAP